MRAWRTLGISLLLLIVAGGVWLWWKKDEPRRTALAPLQNLANALHRGDSTKLLEAVSIPEAIRGRTTAEQAEFLNKALRDEISPEGLKVLRREGEFGSLTNLFPAEAKIWAEQAGVNPEDCVAFKLERNGLRAEVVLAYDSALRAPNSALKIVRCNNVKQLAAAKL